MTTSLYAGVLALMFIMLSSYVVQSRRKHNVALGDDGINEISRRVRAQGNFSEYSTLFIVLLYITERNQMPPHLVHFFGVVFLCGRVMHAYSLLIAEKYVNGKITARPSWRFSGMVFTFTCIASLGVMLILQYLMRYHQMPNYFY